MKDIKFEQLDDKKFQELNEEEMKKIKGGKMAPQSDIVTCFSNGKSSTDDPE